MLKKDKRPKKSKVGGFDYEIEWLPEVFDDDGEEACGTCNSDFYKIKIATKFHLLRIKSTLLHEFIHALDELICLNLSEEQVSLLANVLFAWLRENKSIITYLTEDNEPIKPEDRKEDLPKEKL